VNGIEAALAAISISTGNKANWRQRSERAKPQIEFQIPPLKVLSSGSS